MMTGTALTQEYTRPPLSSPHPNEVDCKRVERALAARERYRYVSPRVYQVHNGYRIESPCCSRNIDKEGGVIDIARLEYLPLRKVWLLYRKDHRRDQWDIYAELPSLGDVLELLKCDPLRVFWP